MPNRINHIINIDDKPMALCGVETKDKKPSRNNLNCYDCMSINLADYNRLVTDFNELVEKNNEMAKRLNLILVTANPSVEVSDINA